MPGPGSQKLYKTRSKVHRPTRAETPEPVKAQTRERLKADLDDLLNDIDEALVGLDEEFAVKYIQHGGE